MSRRTFFQKKMKILIKKIQSLFLQLTFLLNNLENFSFFKSNLDFRDRNTNDKKKKNPKFILKTTDKKRP